MGTAIYMHFIIKAFNVTSTKTVFIDFSHQFLYSSIFILSGAFKLKVAAYTVVKVLYSQHYNNITTYTYTLIDVYTTLYWYMHMMNW